MFILYKMQLSEVMEIYHYSTELTDAQVCVYLICSILAVLAVLTNVMLQFLDLQLDLIVLLPYFIGLCAFPLDGSIAYK